MHSDASQSIGKVDVNVNALNVDFVTVTGHKFYGPRIGALVIRAESKVSLRAMFLGGNQEESKRAGYVISGFSTQNLVILTFNLIVLFMKISLRNIKKIYCSIKDHWTEYDDLNNNQKHLTFFLFLFVAQKIHQ